MPPSCTPTTSCEVYTLIARLESTRWQRVAWKSWREATTTLVGKSFMISMLKEGPERKARGCSRSGPSASAIAWPMSCCVGR